MVLLSARSAFIRDSSPAVESATAVDVEEFCELLDGVEHHIYYGEIFLPIRFVADYLDMPIEWDEYTSTAYIGRRGLPRHLQTNLIFAAEGFPWTLDPIQATDDTTALITRQAFDTLVELDYETMEVVPSLATNWDMPDAMTLNMELRRDVVFHNGHPLTARDVAFSLERGAYIVSASRELGMIEYVEIHDNYNFTIHLSKPFAPILRNLALPRASIISEYALLGYGLCPLEFDKITDYIGRGHMPVIGTGPFEVDEFIHRSIVQFIRNDDYWGEVAQVESLTIVATPVGADRLRMVEYGEADIAPVNPHIDVFNRANTMVERVPTLVMSDYIGFNVSRYPWNNPLVMQAVMYALDAQRIYDIAFEDSAVGIPATGFVSSRAWGFYETEPFEHNLLRARELMAEAGYADGFSREVTILVNYSNPERLRSALVVQADLSFIGIDAHIEILDLASFVYARWHGEPDVFLGGFVNHIGDIDYELFEGFHSSGRHNSTRHNDPVLDALIMQGRAEIDPELRREIYIEALRRLRDNPSTIPIRETERLFLVSSYVQGLTVNPLGHHRFNSVYFAFPNQGEVVSIVVNGQRQDFPNGTGPRIFEDRIFLSVSDVERIFGVSLQ